MNNGPPVFTDNTTILGDGTPIRPLSGIQIAKVTLTSAQVLALKENPVQIVPSPLAGKIVLPVLFVIRYLYGGTPYTVGAPGTQELVFAYSAEFPLSGSDYLFYQDTSGFLDQTANMVTEQTSFSYAPIPESLADGQGISLGMSAGSVDVTAGNGTLEVLVFYYTIGW